MARDKIAFFINTSSFERVSFSLAIAVSYAALNNEVNILFGYSGIQRLKKDIIDEIGDETDILIREKIRYGIQKKGVTKISESLEMIKKLGGKIYACPAAMALHNLTREDLIDLCQVRGIVEFIREETKDAKIIYV